MENNKELDGELDALPSNRIVRTKIPEDVQFRLVHVVAYILAAVIGREYSGWQSGLSVGFGMFGVAQMFIAIACITYQLCLAEIWSAIPFSGGSYGLARASMGFFVGFLDGCCETLVYVSHSALSAMQLGGKLVAMFDLPDHYQLVFCFIFYFIAVMLTIQPNMKFLRRCYMRLAVISTAVLLAYLLGMLKYVNFLKNAPLHNSPRAGAFDNWFTGGMSTFMTVLPLAMSPYAGMKSFALLTIVTKDPKTTLPRAVIIAFCVIFCVNFVVLFVFAAQPGGILHTASLPFPMTVGNQLMFGLSPEDTARLTLGLSIPSTAAKLLTYILPSGNLLHCLGNSYYLPPFLFLNKTKDRTNGCIVSGVFGMLLCITMYYQPTFDLFNVTVIATMITCCTFIYSYVELKTTYSNVERSFVSPFGIPGAVLSFLMMLVILVSAAFFSGTWFNLKFLAVLIAALTGYYYTIARTGDQLCEEEDRIFLHLHIRNFNILKKRHLRHHKHPKRGHRVHPTAGAAEEATSQSCSYNRGGGSDRRHEVTARVVVSSKEIGEVQTFDSLEERRDSSSSQPVAVTAVTAVALAGLRTLVAREYSTEKASVDDLLLLECISPGEPIAALESYQASSVASLAADEQFCTY